MISTPVKLRAADLFCGAGGMTTGAVQSGTVDPVLAVNHWQTAIFTHQNNHPNTRHICARIEDFNLADERLPDIDLLMAGIECIHHSNARGSAPINDQARASAWRVLDWMIQFRPEWCVFENVREFLKWGPIDENGRKIKSQAGEVFNAWKMAIESLGYSVEYKLLNAADFGAHTKRIRLFIVCRLQSKSSFRWPERTHFQPPKKISDRLVGVNYWKPAYEIIDWSIPCPSIFDRKKPLVDKSLRRIRIGLEKFVENNPDPFIVKYHGGADPRRDGTDRQYSVESPLPTIDSQPRFALCKPYGVLLKGTGTAFDLSHPAPTICGGGTHQALTIPYGVNLKGNSDSYLVDQPLPTMTAHAGHLYLAQPFLYQLIGRGAGRSDSICKPMKTIIASRNGHNVVVPFMVPRFGERAGQQPRCFSVADPMATVTGQGAGSIVAPYLMDPNWQENRGGRNRVHQLCNSLGTITTCNQKHVVMPYILPRQGFFDSKKLKRCNCASEPLPTITASHIPAHVIQPYMFDVNHGDDKRTGNRVYSMLNSIGTLTSKLGKAIASPRIQLPEQVPSIPHVENPTPAMTELLDTMKRIGVYDIGFRMLTVPELKAAQGFPNDYELHGGKTEQIKQIGNSVCPAVMKALCESINEQDVIHA